MSKVYDFIGERRFGGIKRQATVIFMKENIDLINGAKGGREAQKAMRLSYQFQNLGRGASFVQAQLEKWKNPIILEYITMMDRVTGWFEVTQYSDKKLMGIYKLVENTWLVRYPQPVEITYD